MEDRVAASTGPSKISVRFSRVLRVFRLRAESGLPFESNSFKMFLYGWISDPCVPWVWVYSRWLLVETTSQESQCLLDRAAVHSVVLSHGSVVLEVIACVREALLW